MKMKRGAAKRSAAARKAVCDAFNRAGFYRLIGLVAESPKLGRSRVRLKFRPAIANLYGVPHGGAITALADAAISIALATLVEPGSPIATVELTVQFSAPAGRRDLVAEGTIHRAGRRLGFGGAVIRAVGASGRRGEVVAHAQGVWAISGAKT